MLGVTDADFCCGMRRPGDAVEHTESANISTASDAGAGGHGKGQNKNHYTPHQHLRTHLRGPSLPTDILLSSSVLYNLSLLSVVFYFHLFFLFDSRLGLYTLIGHGLY